MSDPNHPPKQQVVTPEEGFQFKDKMGTWDHEYCPNCEAETWQGIPDSLAQVCKNCGFVRVGHSKFCMPYEAGATLGEWARDMCRRKRDPK